MSTRKLQYVLEPDKSMNIIYKVEQYLDHYIEVCEKTLIQNLNNTNFNNGKLRLDV